MANCLSGFKPKPGDGIFLPAGTVHSLRDTVVFEIEENSDVTFRLYDWDLVDPKTKKGRPLQIEQAMACIDFSRGPVKPVVPVTEEKMPVSRERLFLCGQFGLWRLHGGLPFTVGAPRTPRALVCLGGDAQLEYEGAHYVFGKGDVLFLPAAVGECECQPRGIISLLEISLPEGTATK